MQHSFLSRWILIFCLLFVQCPCHHLCFLIRAEFRYKKSRRLCSFCFSFFCFFRSTHVNQNTAAFFSLSVTRTVYVQSVSRSRMRKIPAHKKIILFYAILPVLSSRVPFRFVRSLGTPQRFYSHILPIFCVLYAGFQKMALSLIHI